jgi:hypothetical protein
MLAGIVCPWSNFNIDMSGGVLFYAPLKQDLALVTGTGVATFTRSTVGTYNSTNTGFIETAAIDEPRFEADGLLLEGAHTNYQYYSSDYTNAQWTGNSVGTITRTLNSGIAPNGLNDAVRLVYSGAFVSNKIDLRSQPNAVTTSNTVVSIYAKSNTGLEQTLNLSVSGANVKSVTVTDEWQRFTTRYDPANKWHMRLGLQAIEPVTSPNADILVWNSDHSMEYFQKSTIVTGSSAVTKAADSLSYPAGTNFNPAEFTITCEFNVLGLELAQGIWQIDGSVFSATVQADGKVRIEGANMTLIEPTTPVVVGVLNTLSVDYVTGTFTVDLNGEVIVSNQTNLLAAGTNIRIGESDGGKLYGHVSEFRIFGEVVTGGGTDTVDLDGDGNPDNVLSTDGGITVTGDVTSINIDVDDDSRADVIVPKK